MAADDDRHRAVDRLRLDIGVFEFHEFAVEAGLFCGPQFAHDVYVLIRAAASVVEGHA